METKNILRTLIILCLFFQILTDNSVNPLEKTNYNVKNIKDLQSSFFNSVSDGFYYLGSDFIAPEYTIIAFSDLNGDGFTDIITYNNTDDIYEFRKHIYNKEELKFDESELLFKVINATILSPRNLYAGRIYGDQTCFLASFNLKNNNEKLLHLINCGDKTEQNQVLGITSNILIMNRNTKDRMQILFHNDEGLKICSIDTVSHECKIEKDFCNDTEHNKYKISLKGGLAYVDIDGNCAPDVILSYEDEQNYRHIIIYLYDRKNDEYKFNKDIKVGPSDDYGAFTISRIENEKPEDKALNFDILVPNIKNNQIKAYINQIKKTNGWSEVYCKEDQEEFKNETIFEDTGSVYELPLKTINNENSTLDNSFVTVIRPGDFLSDSSPGILVRQNFGAGSKAISLYSKKDKQYVLHYLIKKENVMAEPKLALFFDINESGFLGLIVKDENETNHFFFNSRNNNYFIKSKLISSDEKDFYSDGNLGAIFRYVVTDKNGKRYLDLSYQLAQTSDMNIPLPYSLIGIGETNNYIENFQAVSGNYYSDRVVKFEDSEFKNFKLYTPIIPKTQMMIYKFKNKNTEYEWNIDLIVQPTDSLILIIIVLVVVMFAILGIVIYLYVREVKEEQKEESKFKSWFA